MSPDLISLIGNYGVAIVFVNVLLDQLGLPIPVIPTLIVAGTLAAGGKLSAPGLFVASVIACLIADCLWFVVGQVFGMRVLKTLCRISLEPDSCVSQTQGRFERWGVNSLLIAKFVPGLAIIAPPMAGALRISWPRFTALSTVGACLWVAAGLGAGMLFKSQIEHVFAHLERIGGLAFVGFLLLLAAYIAFKWWERRRFYATLRMARISVDDLYRLIEAGAEPVIIDVRSSTARTLEPRWIPGARHVPLEEMSPHVKDLPRDRDIIIYCTCPNEASAAQVAKQLMNHGFTRVRPLHGGLDAWIAAGFAVDSSLKSETGAEVVLSALTTPRQ